jgi:ribose 5-phosphate isomerase B
MLVKNIVIGSDHAGFKLKGILIDYLEKKGFKLTDAGCFSEESVDYPDVGHAVASLVEENGEYAGILICGSGNGINMTANKHQKIRSALCWNKEVTKLAREHNDANIIVLPARFITDMEATDMVDVFFSVSFEGGRHEKRVDKISC